MSKKKKVTISIIVLLALCTILNIKLLKNETGSFTIIETIMNKYADFTIELNENSSYVSLQDALDSAQEGEIVYITGNLNIEEDITIPKGVTVNVNSSSNVTIAEDHTLEVIGSFMTSASSAVNVYGNIVLKYDSYTGISGTIYFYGEAASLTTESIENATEEYATLHLKKGSSFLGDDNFSKVLYNLNNIKLENFGTNTTDDITTLFKDSNIIVSYGIHTIEDGIYVSSFNDVPENSNVEVTSFLYLNEDQIIADGVTINVNEDNLIVIDANLTVNGTLTMNDNLLKVKELGGNGKIYLTPGEDANNYNTLVDALSSTLEVYVQGTPSYGQSLITVNGTIRGSYTTSLIEKLTSVYKNLNLKSTLDGFEVVSATYVPYNSFFGKCTWSNLFYEGSVKYETKGYCKGYYITFTYSAFPDKDLYDCVLDEHYALTNSEKRPISYNKLLSNDELNEITTLSCNTKNDENGYIINRLVKDATGIEKLTNLQTLDLLGNDITNINLNPNTKLISVDLSNNKLESLTFEDNTKTKLETMNLSNNNLELLNLGSNNSVKTLKISNNKITELDLINAKELIELDASNNMLETIELRWTDKIEKVNLENNATLTSIGLYNLKLKELNANNTSISYFTLIPNQENISMLEKLYLNNTKLERLSLHSTPYLKEIHATTTMDLEASFGEVPNLENITLSTAQTGTISGLNLSTATKLESININNFDLEDAKLNYTSIKHINLSNNAISTMDLTTCPNLETLSLAGNRIESLDITNCNNLKSLNMNNTNISNLTSNLKSTITQISLRNSKLTEFNASLFPNLIELDLTNSKNIKTIDLSNNNVLQYPIVNGLKFEKNIYLTRNDIEQGHEINIEESGIKFPNGFEKKFGVVGDKIVNIERGVSSQEVTYNYNLQYTTNNIEHAIAPHAGVTYLQVMFDIKYNYYVPSVTSDKYLVDEDNMVIYVYDDKIENVMSNLNIEGAVGNINGNKLELKYLKTDEEIVESYDIVGVSTDSEDENNLIKIYEKTTISEAKESFVKIGQPIIKAYYSNGEEVISDNDIIKNGMTFKIIYKDKVYETFNFEAEYIDLTEVVFDEENHLIKNLDLGTKISVFESVLDGSGTFTYYDKNNQLLELKQDDILMTGMKVKIELAEDTYEYTLSVKGDVTGTGVSTISDVMRMIDHALTDNKLTELAFLSAADLNNDKEISVSDVMYLVNMSLN